MHPLARPDNQSGAFDMNAGDRVIHMVDGRHGVADEFLHDGDALVSFDDGSFEIVKWAQLRKEPPRSPLGGPRAAARLDAIDAPPARSTGRGRIVRIYRAKRPS